MKTKIIAILTIFLDVIGLTIIIPAMPQLVEYYHTSNTMISLGFTIYSLLALIATPLLGTLSDKYGRKPVLIYSTI
jgi:MFS family permease